MTKFNIRKAEKGDCEEIMRLIKELATFEKMPNSVLIDARDLERDGFETKNPSFKCLVVDDPENIITGFGAKRLIGYALFCQTYGTWEGKRYWLEDIMVTEKYRRHGIGKQLISAVCKDAVENNIVGIRFAVLDWNPANEFYKEIGAINTTKTIGWQHSELHRNKIKELSKLCY